MAFAGLLNLYVYFHVQHTGYAVLLKKPAVLLKLSYHRGKTISVDDGKNYEAIALVGLTQFLLWIILNNGKFGTATSLIVGKIRVNS